MLHTFEMKNRDPVVRRPPRGRCIYCGAIDYRAKKDRKLGDEHVIAESLGGTLSLGEAACEYCEEAINSFEQPILRTVLYAPRVHVGVRRKRRKRAEETIKVQGKVGDRDIDVFLPIKKVPVLLFFLRLGPPGILVGRLPNVPDMKGAWICNLTSGPFVPPGFQSFASPILDTIKFSQFLAKIAHGFAVDVLGDGFHPMLPDFIRNKASDQRYDLIGGKLDNDPPSDNLHELGIDWVRANGIDYAVVEIRLFSNLGAPTYRVVAGIPKTA